MMARCKPCDPTRWKWGRWRPVRRTRITNHKDDCAGGGVPMGVGVVIYADKPSRFGEFEYDFMHNVEVMEK
jgi:hypothetical protein